MAESHISENELPLETAGHILCRAREAQGLTRAQIAELTKIPERHLLAIEENNFAALPARTYSVGFSRNYARALGVDEAEIIRLVRADLDGAPVEQPARAATFEPGDPARIPSSAFAWLAGILALGVVIAGFVFWRSYYSPAAELPPIVADAPPAQSAPSPVSTPVAAGQVVFTALEPGVWVKFYDASGQLLQKELAQGETYAVPANANGPMLWTARPQALGIAIDGKPVPKLSETQTTLKDVPVSATALLARPAPVAAAVPMPAPRPSALTKSAAPRAAAPRPAATPSQATSAPAAQPVAEASTVSQ